MDVTNKPSVARSGEGGYQTDARGCRASGGAPGSGRGGPDPDPLRHRREAEETWRWEGRGGGTGSCTLTPNLPILIPPPKKIL